MTKLDRPDASATVEHATVYLAFELSKAKWKLGVMLPGSQKLSRYTIEGGDWGHWRAAWRTCARGLRHRADRCAYCHATRPALTDTGCIGG